MSMLGAITGAITRCSFMMQVPLGIDGPELNVGSKFRHKQNEFVVLRKPDSFGLMEVMIAPQEPCAHERDDRQMRCRRCGLPWRDVVMEHVPLKSGDHVFDGMTRVGVAIASATIGHHVAVMISNTVTPPPAKPLPPVDYPTTKVVRKISFTDET